MILKEKNIKLLKEALFWLRCSEYDDPETWKNIGCMPFLYFDIKQKLYEYGLINNDADNIPNDDSSSISTDSFDIGTMFGI